MNCQSLPILTLQLPAFFSLQIIQQNTTQLMFFLLALNQYTFHTGIRCLESQRLFYFCTTHLHKLNSLRQVHAENSHVAPNSEHNMDGSSAEDLTKMESTCQLLTSSIISVMMRFISFFGFWQKSISCSHRTTILVLLAVHGTVISFQS